MDCWPRPLGWEVGKKPFCSDRFSNDKWLLNHDRALETFARHILYSLWGLGWSKKDLEHSRLNFSLSYLVRIHRPRVERVFHCGLQEVKIVFYCPRTPLS